METGTSPAGDEVRHWTRAVCARRVSSERPNVEVERVLTHEDPEARQGRRRLEHAVECEDHTEHERGDVSGRFGIWQGRDDHVRERAREQHELTREEQHQSTRLPGLVLAKNCKVPGDPDQDAKKKLVWYLHEDVGDEECYP